MAASFTATKASESTFEGFATENQGTYVYNGTTEEGNNYIMTFVVGETTINCNVNYGKVSMDYTLAFVSELEGVYTFAENEDSLSFYFVGSTLTVTNNTIGVSNGIADTFDVYMVIEKDTQYSLVANALGEIVVTFNTPGTYTLTYDASSAFSAMVGTTTVANGGAFTVADGETVTITITSMRGLSVSFIVETAKSGSGETGGETGGGTETPTTPVAVVGEA